MRDLYFVVRLFSVEHALQCLEMVLSIGAAVVPGSALKSGQGLVYDLLT